MQHKQSAVSSASISGPTSAPAESAGQRAASLSWRALCSPCSWHQSTWWAPPSPLPRTAGGWGWVEERGGGVRDGGDGGAGVWGGGAGQGHSQWTGVGWGGRQHRSTYRQCAAHCLPSRQVMHGAAVRSQAQCCCAWRNVPGASSSMSDTVCIGCTTWPGLAAHLRAWLCLHQIAPVVLELPRDLRLLPAPVWQRC